MAVAAPSSEKRCLRAVLFACVVLMVDYNYDALGKVRVAASAVLYPVSYAVSKPVEYFNVALSYVQRQDELIESNDDLRQQLFQAHAEVQRFAAVRSENERLRELLAAARTLEQPSLLAELMGIDRQPLRQQLIVDRGATEGVAVGQAVVDAFGIMGQVVHVDALSSRVLLITDPTHSIPVRIESSGVRMLAFGSGDSELELRFLPAEADIRVGDLVVSSGLGEVFPSSYPVGRVSRIEPGNTAVAPPRVFITPSAKIETSHQFLLVRSNNG